MSFIKEIKKGLKKTEKVIRKARDDTVDFVKNIPGGSHGDKYRAKKCFEILKKHNIKVCSQDTGEEISSAETFLSKGLYVYQTVHGQYDLKFCMHALSKRGVVKCDYLEEVLINKFSSDECFTIFKENDVTLCKVNTNIHIVQKNNVQAILECSNTGHPCQVAPDWETDIYNWDGTYNLEVCENEFGQKDIVRCAGEQDHAEL